VSQVFALLPAYLRQLGVPEADRIAFVGLYSSLVFVVGLPLVPLWGVWADLPFPTMITPFDRARLAEIKHALAAHASELARLPLDRMVEARAVLAAGVGEERVHGSGLAGDPAVELAELLCEVMLEPGGWMLGSPRRFDADAPIASASKRAIGWWLQSESVHARLRRGG